MIFFWLFIFLIPLVDCFLKSNVNNMAGNTEVLNTRFLNIVKIRNFGSALGIFKNHPHFVLVSTALIICLLISMVFIKKVKNKVLLLSISFIAGGGIGNLIDRLSVGYVTDYIKIKFFPPAFNLSDCFICLGVMLFIVYALKDQA